MSTFKAINASKDIKQTKSFLNQLVDIIETDVSSSVTRRSYQVFVTGGVGPGVTSSLFQTVYDQDFTLQTANPTFDLTVGIFSGSALVASSSTGLDTDGKLLFPSQSLMMREKIANYKQLAQLLLGNADSQFSAPYSNATASSDSIDTAMFINFKRLFSRDRIKRESFAMRFYTSASYDSDYGGACQNKPNLSQTSESGSMIFTDVGSSANLETSFGGEVGNIVNASNTNHTVGTLFYQQGIAVFDMAKIISGTQHVSGVISSVTTQTVNGVAGRVCLGSGYGTSLVIAGTNQQAKFIPDLVVSASIDDIVNHIAACRFQSGSNTAITFQNLTNINSTLIFCRATADEFNYSSNPTYVNTTTNKIKVIETGQESSQRAFAYITTVGLYDENENLLAVAKMSRPIEKNNEKDITIRVRLDF